MRRGFGLIWVGLTGLIVGLVAWFAYSAGLAANVASPGNGTVIVERGDFGFGFFPLLFLILLLLLVFRRRRWGGYWGGRGWSGHSHGPGGHSHGPGGNRDWDVPPVIEEKLKSWHDKAHGTATAEPGAGEGADKPPVT
ncbi:MAG TPA: hypothetical protein VG329_05385 [Candidatus Dormibacteraeota bacterium]|nr:hypothetical protein [Candidatus Dormibacteraeota bacterium]